MNFKIFISISSIVLLFAACNLLPEKEIEIPEGIIPEDKMVVILADMQISEAYLSEIRKTSERLKDSTLLYYKKVYKKNMISKDQFEKSLLYYKEDLENLEQIYTQVVVRLNELKAKNDEILLEMKADSVRRDSLNTIRIQDSLRAIIVADSVALLQDTVSNDIIHSERSRKLPLQMNAGVNDSSYN